MHKYEVELVSLWSHLQSACIFIFTYELKNTIIQLKAPVPINGRIVILIEPP